MYQGQREEKGGNSAVLLIILTTQISTKYCLAGKGLMVLNITCLLLIAVSVVDNIKNERALLALVKLCPTESLENQY